MAHRDADRLSDLANAASYLAGNSNRHDDHSAASIAHMAAHVAAKSAGRDGLSTTHLRRAVEHDLAGNKPESYEYKKTAANRLSADAGRDNDADAHDAAAKAHDDAAKALKKRSAGRKGGEDSWQLEDHARRADEHAKTAAFLREEQAGESTSVSGG
jgi:hypothetical protein